jgi:diketogulonate reductase-like aldo/keto reductase
MSIPLVTLNNGVRIPQLGLGTARVEDEEVRRIVGTALGLGYRLIDTAAKYENELGVGQGIADAGLARTDLFITSKLRGRDQGFASTKAALAQTLERLGLDHLDLYLIHWPLPRVDNYLESWRAMEELLAEGLTRAIGVSNFLPEHLDKLAKATATVPAVNQIELHPGFQQRAQIADDTRRGIVTQSWSPLANAGALLKDPVLAEIGDRHGKSPVQVVLAWHLRQGLVVIPKASAEDRLRANLDVFDLTLTDDDVRRIDALDTGVQVGGQDPSTHEEF